jgi:hypothetical protein
MTWNIVLFLLVVSVKLIYTDGACSLHSFLFQELLTFFIEKTILFGRLIILIHQIIYIFWLLLF